MKKFSVKFSDKVNRPILIIGQNPGRQRLREQTEVAWEGNRSSDLLRWCLDGQSNYILTNICNYQEMTPERVEEGMNDVIQIIKRYKPSLIICLGNFSYDKMMELKTGLYKYKPIPVPLPHPSYIARFNRDKHDYKRQIQDLFKEDSTRVHL